MAKTGGETSKSKAAHVDTRKRRLAAILAEEDSKECVTPAKRMTRSSTTTPMKEVDSKDSEAIWSIFKPERYKKKKTRGSSEELVYRFPPKLMEVSEIPETGKINTYSKTSYLITIKNVLQGTEEWDFIKESQFWGIFQIPTRKASLSGRLLHHMLCRQLLTKKRHELWFLFSNRPIRFSLREFAIVTGLNCSQFPPDKEIKVYKDISMSQNAYWFELFGDELKEGLIKDIVTFLTDDMKKPVNQRMSRIRRLRLCLIVLVDGILCCKNAASVKASPLSVEMVKNVEMFLDFPWGRRSFETTLEMVLVGSTAKNTIDHMLLKLNSQVNLAVKGFSIAFQLVFFRTIPALMMHLTTKGADIDFNDPDLEEIDACRDFNNDIFKNLDEDPETDVYSILDYGRGSKGKDYTWKDDCNDEAVDRMLEQIEDGHVFVKEDWVKGTIVLPPPLQPHIMSLVERIPKKEPIVDEGEASKGAKPAAKNQRKSKKPPLCKKSNTGSRKPVHDLDPKELDPLGKLVHFAVKESQKRTFARWVESADILLEEQSHALYEDIMAKLNNSDLGSQIKAALDKQPGKETNVDAPASRAGKDKVFYPTESDTESDDDCALRREGSKAREVSQSKAASSPFPWDDGFDADAVLNKTTLVDLKADEGNDLDSAHQDIVVDQINQDEGKTRKAEGVHESGNTRPLGEEPAKSTTVQDNLAEYGDHGEGVTVDNTDTEAATGMKDLSLSVFIQGDNDPNPSADTEKDETGQDVSPSSYLVMDDKERGDIDHDQAYQVPMGAGSSEMTSESGVLAATKDAILALPVPKPDKNNKKKKETGPITRSQRSVVGEANGMGPVSAELFDALQNTLANYQTDSIFVRGVVVPTITFEQIYKPKNHVATDAMNLMVESGWARLEGQLAPKGIMFLDSHFPSLIMKEHKTYINADDHQSFQWNQTLTNIIRGANRNRRPPSDWFVHVQRVYCPMNWETEGHWVGLSIDLISGEVLVLDCLQDLTTPDRVAAIMAPFFEILSLLLQNFVSPDIRAAVPLRFFFKRPVNVYQNTRSGDCGPVSVKFMELHALGLPLDCITNAKVDNLRKNYAVDIYQRFVLRLT